MDKRSIENNIILKGGLDNIANAPRNDICVVLDNIRSMHNVGAIFRTCDAARIKMLYLCGITATPPRPQIQKTALNTLDYQPWQYRKSTLRLIHVLQKQGYQIVALEQTTKSINYKNFSATKPFVLVVGNEIEGVSNKVLASCDLAIEIPMHGIANSLNVATSVGVVLFSII